MIFYPVILVLFCTPQLLKLDSQLYEINVILQKSFFRKKLLNTRKIPHFS